MKPAFFTLALCLLLLPFINKAFHVDEPFYLKMAEQIRRDPLRPYSFSINWSGETRQVWERVEATFPPLVPVYQALIVSLFGEKEWALHLSFIPFAFLALLAFWHLANRWTEHPYLATALFFGAPAFFVMATTLMLDVPMLAFSLLGVLFLVEGLEDGKPMWPLWVSGIFFALSALTKYTGLLNLIVAALYGWVMKKPFRRWALPIALACGIFGIWCLHNLWVYGSIHVLRAAAHVGKGMSLHKALALACFIGGGLWFPILFHFFCAERPSKFANVFAGVSVILMAIFVSGIIFLEQRSADLYTLSWALFFSSLTLLLLVAILTERPWNNPIGRFLLTWFGLALLSLCVWEPWVSARYLLPMLAPSVLLFVRARRQQGWRHILCAIFAGSGLMVSFPLARVDKAWAADYKIFAQEDLRRFKIEKVDGFMGHWGFQYYMERAGAKPYEISQKKLPEGFVMAYATLPDPQSFPYEIDLLDGRKGLWQPIKQVTASGYRMRLANPSGSPPTGFYSSLWGILPYSSSKGSLETFYVMRLAAAPQPRRKK